MTAFGALAVGAPTAVAAVDPDGPPDGEWKLTGEPADDAALFLKLNKRIREAVSSHQVRVSNEASTSNGTVTRQGSSPVYVTDEDGRNQYATFDLYTIGGPEFIRIYLRRLDGYFLGWRTGREVNGTRVWDRYYTLSAEAAPTVDAQGNLNPGRLPGSTSATTIRRFEGVENYTDLARYGATREGLRIGVLGLDQAILYLHAAADNNILFVAPAVLRMIVAFAEGSRFKNQAVAMHRAWGRGEEYELTPQHMAQHNEWATGSAVVLGAVLAGTLLFSPAVEFAGVLYESSIALAAIIMLAHHSGKNTKGGKKLEGTNLLVAQDGFGDHTTVQAAIDAVPDYGATTIWIDKGVYREVINVPKDKPWLTIQGITGTAWDVLIYNDRCNGMINPATGTKWGTQGSAVATFRPPGMVVMDVAIRNTFDRNAHPEISPYETQAVALCAMGDRQVYDNVTLISHQDTLLCKGVQPTDQARQYFVNCEIRGDVDFIFGNATTVIDRSDIIAYTWPGGSMLAPNTDYRKKYGILITQCSIRSTNSPMNSMHLGRPWHNSAEAWPQAVVRESEVFPHINAAQPWTDMVPDYHWQQARFREYKNSGLSAGIGGDAPKLTDAEALEYTAKKYLSGTDGWNPVV